MQIPANSTFLRKYNRANILNIIRTSRYISRSDLSRRTGLSQTAIGTLIAELIQEDYITETGMGKSRGGRKPILLQINKNSHYSVGVDLALSQVRIVIIDLVGSVILEKLYQLDDYSDYRRVFQYIEAKVKECLDECQILFDRLLGISIAVPGAVSNSLHKILYSPSLRWEDISVPPYFDSIPNVPVLVENDANAFAIYENWLGSCKGLENFVCVVQTSGIGAGAFVNGKLYRGTDGVSNQIGHIQVDENGPLCRCGNYGCLEAMAADSYSVEKMKRMIRQGVASLHHAANIDQIDIERIRLEAFDGNEAAMKILTDAAMYLGIGVSIIINILNPSKIVFGKGYYHLPDVFMERIKSVANNKLLKIYKSSINIEASGAKDGAIAIGAGIIPLKSLFGEEVELHKK